MVEVAAINIKVALAQIDEAKAGVNKFQASVDRWQSEVTRLSGLSTQGVVDKQVLEESQKQLKADTASRDAARAIIVAAQATELAKKADFDKAQADVAAAKAKAKVSAEDVKRVAALVSYTHTWRPTMSRRGRNANGDCLAPVRATSRYRALPTASRPLTFPSMWWPAPARSASMSTCPRRKPTR